MTKRTWIIGLSLSTTAFYLVLVLEFLFMISPLALHFYVGYGPVLRVLHASPLTSWLTGFFLPHFSQTTSAALNVLKPIGFFLAFGGLIAFLAGAVHLYTSKLLRQGAVTGGLYRVIRHPQYAALAVLGLGTVLIWPRFLVLASFVVMLCLYDLLARWEEARCLERFGEPYSEYLGRTGRFFPRFGPPRKREVIERMVEISPLPRLAVSAAVLVVSLVTAFGLREMTLHNLSVFYEGNRAVLSPAVLDRSELERAYRIAKNDVELNAQLSSLEPSSPMVVHVVPADWYLPDLPLHGIDEILRERGGHETTRSVGRTFKVLFARARTHRPKAVGPELIKSTFGLDPILIVAVDTGEGEIRGHAFPPATVVWGDIPTPLF
jgi:protein-S-isoprenylcysteine O-methyltransferase Ste14